MKQISDIVEQWKKDLQVVIDEENADRDKNSGYYLLGIQVAIDKMDKVLKQYSKSQTK